MRQAAMVPSDDGAPMAAAPLPAIARSEEQPPAMSTDNAAVAAAKYLSGLGETLAAAYPRSAHRGRLEQIDSAAANLAGLVAELPGEEEREAEYEGRILDAYRSGTYNRQEHPSHTHDRLADALARQEG